MSLPRKLLSLIFAIDQPLLKTARKQEPTTHPFYVARTTMAEATTPTFKLVLVGDGGTGKVTRPQVPGREMY